MKSLPAIQMGGDLGRRIEEALEISRQYRGYVWSQLFQKNLAQMGTLFAILLGTGGLLSKGGSLFTLSLPVTRRHLLAVRARVGLLQWLALAMIPPLVIPLLSPAVGESYSIVSALAHGFCLFVAGAVFFSFALLLSTVFGDVWRPLLIAILVATALAIPAELVSGYSRYTLSGVMGGETFFRTGHLPWLGLLISAALSMALVYGAARNFERRDF
jgi:ABC-type transport system involved in multi-copper enzyme maturation permease subunit